MKKRKGKKKSPLLMKPAKRFAAKVKADELIESTPAAVNALRSTTAVETIAPAKPSEDIPEGMVEIEIKESPYKLLGMRNQSAEPNMRQRLAMAKRLLEVGPKLPKYVKYVLPTTSIGEAVGTKGISKEEMKEIEQNFNKNLKEYAAHEKEKKKREADAAKVAEKKRNALVKSARDLKTKDVTPKLSAADLERIKAENSGKPPQGKGKKTTDKDPGAKVKGVSSPPVKKAAGMAPGEVPKGGFTKENKPGTSGALIRARIMEHKMTDDAIAAEVRKLWPGRTTAVSDVRWNRSQMQKAGVKNVPEPAEGSTVPQGRK